MPKALGPVFILNGPNLNLLGTREPEIYGVETLSDIETACARRAAELSFTAMFRQSNHEGWLIDWIHEASAAEAPIVINPGAYTHTSIALGDALRAVRTPKVEVHLSNIHAREAFRRISHVSPAVDGVICGLGAAGYTLALDAVKRLTEKRNKS